MNSMIGSAAIAVFALIVTGYFVQSRLPPPKPSIVGIDLGTTFSCISTYEFSSGNVTVYKDKDEKNIIPSVVAILENEVLVGYKAVEQIETNSRNTIYDAKRFIGKKISSEKIKQLSSNYPFKVSVNSLNDPYFEIKLRNGTKVFSPEDIGAFILRKLKGMVESAIDRTISMAVISVPADFNEAQRNATIEAGRRAGLKVLRVINEPTAAALAYGLHKKPGINTVIVVDFGGGTLDVSLLMVRDGMFITMAMAGNNRLGGQDINNNLINFVRKMLEEKFGLVEITPNDLQVIRDQVEFIKISLTDNAEAEIKFSLEAISPITGKPISYFYVLSRDDFNSINKELFLKVLDPIKRVLIDAEITKNEIDEIVLVGGSTRVPKVRELVADFFNKVPNTSINPDIAVAIGVAAQAGILGNGWPLKVAAVEIQNEKLRKVYVNEIDEDL
ncbi:heat shock 70 kDa protein 13 [Hydra vulgaris]|uniref:heat shock 70 kDa protein 13 n=1 Tax=Hydra vulgaris TaxID=6087 RepID=UPI0002B43688|nr:heat shock 70 kDa protein 13 [Hydra vulgaris]